MLLVDTENAYSAVNWKTFSRSFKIIFPSISSFVHNCYSKPSYFFDIGVVETSSSEDTIQGDTVAIAVYAIAIISLKLIILKIIDQFAHITSYADTYADDLTAAGTIKGIK